MGLSLSKTLGQNAVATAVGGLANALTGLLGGSSFIIGMDVEGLKIGGVGSILTGGYTLTFPINPEKLEVQDEVNNKVFHMINGVDYNYIGHKKLRVIRWSSWIPKENWFPAYIKAGLVSITMTPQLVQSIFEYVWSNKKYVKLYIPYLGISGKYTIESYNWDHHGGAFEDRYYSIQLKEYRDYNIGIKPTTSDDVVGTFMKELVGDLMTKMLGGKGSLDIANKNGGVVNHGKGTGELVSVPTKLTLGTTVLLTGAYYLNNLHDALNNAERNAIEAHKQTTTNETLTVASISEYNSETGVPTIYGLKDSTGKIVKYATEEDLSIKM